MKGKETPYAKRLDVLIVLLKEVGFYHDLHVDHLRITMLGLQ